MTETCRTIQLFSGGLGSILSVRIMIEEGFEVIALHFYTGFNGVIDREIATGSDWTWTPEQRVVDAAEMLDIQLDEMDVSDE